MQLLQFYWFFFAVRRVPASCTSWRKACSVFVISKERLLKQPMVFLVAAAVSTLFGCSTSPLILGKAVGPNRFSVSTSESNGELQVFTATERENDVGEEFPYEQRTLYSIHSLD